MTEQYLPWNPNHRLYAYGFSNEDCDRLCGFRNDVWEKGPPNDWEPQRIPTPNEIAALERDRERLEWILDRRGTIHVGQYFVGDRSEIDVSMTDESMRRLRRSGQHKLREQCEAKDKQIEQLHESNQKWKEFCGKKDDALDQLEKDNLKLFDQCDQKDKEILSLKGEHERYRHRAVTISEKSRKIEALQQELRICSKVDWDGYTGNEATGEVIRILWDALKGGE